MALTRNKQLAMYFLLSTRSFYRARIEGLAVIGSGGLDNFPQSAADLVSRFSTVAAPSGFTVADIQILTGQQSKIGDLFVDPSVDNGPHLNKVSIHPERIASALELTYVPSDPECPSLKEGNQVAQFLANLP